MKNPFKPTAGARPPLLTRRSDIRGDFAESIENGPGAPGLLTIFTGPRGIGKTVMLGEIEDEAVKHGWLVNPGNPLAAPDNRLIGASGETGHGVADQHRRGPCSGHACAHRDNGRRPAPDQGAFAHRAGLGRVAEVSGRPAQ